MPEIDEEARAATRIWVLYAGTSKDGREPAFVQPVGWTDDYDVVRLHEKWVANGVGRVDTGSYRWGRVDEINKLDVMTAKGNGGTYS